MSPLRCVFVVITEPPDFLWRFNLDNSEADLTIDEALRAPGFLVALEAIVSGDFLALLTEVGHGRLRHRYTQKSQVKKRNSPMRARMPSIAHLLPGLTGTSL